MAVATTLPRGLSFTRDLDLNRVAMFVQIAEAKGVTAAAARAKLPKSSVSRALTQLEDELGVELVDRRARTFQLTEAGQTFYEAAARGLAAVHDAREELRPTTSIPRGKVRVSAPPGFASFIIAPMMVEFTRRYPDVEIELCVTAGIVDPVRDGFDVVFAIGPLADSSAIVRKCPAIDGAVYGSKAYLEAHGTPRRPADLARHACVLQTRTASKSRWTLRGPVGTTEVDVRGALAVDDLFSALAAAAAGGGLVVLPLHMASREPSAAAMQRVLPDWTVPGEPVRILHAPSRHVPLRVSMFCDAIISASQSSCSHAGST